MKKIHYINKLIFLIIIIFCINVFFYIGSQANTPNDAMLSDELIEGEKNVAILNAILPSSDIIKQSTVGDYEDKPYSEEYIKWLNSSEEEKEKYGEIAPAKEFVAIHRISDDNINSNENESLNNNSNLKIFDTITSENLMATNESSYRITNLRVENQSDSSWCGVYSSLKSLETYLYKNKKVNYNLAEYHMAYMSMKEFGGWLDYKAKMYQNNWTSLGVTKWNSGNNFDDFMIYAGFCMGFYPNYSYNIKGPIIGSNSENCIYYVNDANIKSFNNKKAVVKVKKTVQFANIRKEYGSTIRYYNGNTMLKENEINEFRNAVKSHIKSKGGIWTCTKIDENYFNQSTNSLYINNSNIELDHAVTIIGWDDNYSKNNFLYGKQPKNNGAWIALNSWGEDWGNNGYLYISYEDALVDKWMYGIMDAELSNTKPTAKVEYLKNSNNTVTVKITSTDKINKIYIWKDNDWKIDNSWKKEYITRNSNNKYYTEYTKDTIFTKTFNKNTKEYIQLQDELGNYLNSYLTVEVKEIDDKGPSINYVTGYKNNVWVNENVVINIDANDYTGLHSIPYSFDGGKTWQSKYLKKFMQTTKNIEIVVRDKFNNKTTYKETINVLIDKTKPTFSVVANEGISGTKWVNPVAQKTSHIRLYANDTGGSGVVTGYEYSLDNKNWKIHNTKDSLNSSFNYYFTKNETVYFRVKDRAGNISKVAVVNINMVDVQVPKITSVELKLNNQKTNVTLTIKAIDNQSGLANSAYSFDGGKTWQKGNQKIYYSNQTIKKENIKVRDSVGNIITYNKDIIIKGIDNEQLKIIKVDYTPALTNYTNKDVIAKITLNKKVKTSSSGWNVSRDGKILTKTYKSNTKSDGEKLNIIDAITGAKIETTIKILNIDKTTPKLIGKIIKSSNEKYVKSVRLTLPNIYDAGSGLSINPYSYDEGKTWTNQNSKVYYENGKKNIWIKDKASNILKITETIDNIDRKKPTIASVKGINTTWSNKDITLEVIASDNNTSTGLEYSFDNGKTWQISNKKTYNNTTNEIIISVRDKAGWITSYNNGEKIYLKIDKKAPTINTDSNCGIKTWAKNYDYLNMQIKDTGGSGIQEALWYREKGTDTWHKNNSKDGTYSHYYIKEEDAGKIFEFKVKDKALNESKIFEVDFKYVDFKAPEITSVLVDGNNVNIKAKDEQSGLKEYFDGSKWEKWPLGKDEITLKFSENITISAGTIKIKDNAGNIFTYKNIIKVGTISRFNTKLTYSPSEVTNKSVVVQIKTDIKVKIADEFKTQHWAVSEDGKTLQKTFEDNCEEKLIIIDAENQSNSEIVYVSINNIDKTKTKIIQTYENLEDGKVKVTLISNRELKMTKNWELSKSKLELYRIYENDTEEIVKVKDIFDDEYDIKIKVKIKEIEEDLLKDIKYSQTDYTTDNVTVTIETTKEIKPVDGWNLSTDKKILTKSFSDNYNGIIQLISVDDEDYKVDVELNIQNIVKLYDINSDGKVNLMDLLLLKRHLISDNNERWKLSRQREKSADANKDGKINIIDLLLLKREMLK